MFFTKSKRRLNENRGKLIIRFIGNECKNLGKPLQDQKASMKSIGDANETASYMFQK